VKRKRMRRGSSPKNETSAWKNAFIGVAHQEVAYGKETGGDQKEKPKKAKRSPLLRRRRKVNLKTRGGEGEGGSH